MMRHVKVLPRAPRGATRPFDWRAEEGADRIEGEMNLLTREMRGSRLSSVGADGPAGRKDT